MTSLSILSPNFVFFVVQLKEIGAPVELPDDSSDEGSPQKPADLKYQPVIFDREEMDEFVRRRMKVRVKARCQMVNLYVCFPRPV